MRVCREIKRYWRSSPMWGRIAWIFAVFFSSGSLASLSDIAFAWKGFILDGVGYYREIVEPFGQLIGYILTDSPSKSQVDLITIYALFCAAYRRFFIERLTRHWHTSIEMTLWCAAVVLYNVGIWFVWVLLIAASIMGKLHFTLDIVAALLGFLPVLFPLQIWTLQKLPTDSWQREPIAHILLMHFQENKGRLMVMYYGPIVIAVSAVFVLAAINSGLSRPYVG